MQKDARGVGEAKGNGGVVVSVERKYRKPGVFRIGSEHKKLYALEEKRSEAFKKAGEEWSRITGLKDYYLEVLPLRSA